MKKILIALTALAFVTSAVPAKAGDEAAYAIGGLIGGLILGDALSNNHRHGHHYPREVYVYEQTPQYVRLCRTEWTGYYDHYGRYVQQPRRICEWVPR